MEQLNYVLFVINNWKAYLAFSDIEYFMSFSKYLRCKVPSFYFVTFYLWRLWLSVLQCWRCSFSIAKQLPVIYLDKKKKMMMLALVWWLLLCFSTLQQINSPKSWRSLDLDNGCRPPFKTQRSSSMPTPKIYKGGIDATNAHYKNCGGGVILASAHSPCSDIKERSTRGSISNENNILLDPDILTDYPTQALLLTVLVRLLLCIWQT